MIGKTSPLLLLTIVLPLVQPFTASSETIEDASSMRSPPPAEQFKRLEVMFEPDAYFRPRAQKKPIPHVGEKPKLTFYQTSSLARLFCLDTSYSKAV